MDSVSPATMLVSIAEETLGSGSFRIGEGRSFRQVKAEEMVHISSQIPQFSQALRLGNLSPFVIEFPQDMPIMVGLISNLH